MSLELFVFKAGKYPQGERPKERVQKMVDAYDPDRNYEAPVVIGHKWYSQSDADQYAHGWVKSLRMDGAGKVFAAVEGFSADVKKAMAEKKLRYVSVEIREYDKSGDGQPPYLKAIALLGRDTPAVQGTKLPALFEKAVALDAKLGAEERKELRAVFGELEAKVDLSGTHAAPKGKAPKGGEESVTAKIRAFQKEKGITGFAEAAEAYYTANPGAFEEGGIASREGAE